MKRPFVQVETAPLERDERDRLNDPYHNQQLMLAILAGCWEANAAILEQHGYPTPASWTGRMTRQDITDPAPLEAYRVLQACCDAWQAIRSQDPFRIAHAGFWLGQMTAGDSFRQYQSRNSSAPRSAAKEEARALFQAHRPGSCKAFELGLAAAGISATREQARNWYTDFKKYFAT